MELVARKKQPPNSKLNVDSPPTHLKLGANAFPISSFRLLVQDLNLDRQLSRGTLGPDFLTEGFRPSISSGSGIPHLEIPIFCDEDKD